MGGKLEDIKELIEYVRPSVGGTSKFVFMAINTIKDIKEYLK